MRISSKYQGKRAPKERYIEMKKSLKKKRPAPYDKIFTDEELEQLEKEFIDTYISSEIKPLRMLLKIYLKYWKELLVSLFFYFLKTSPVLAFPIITANLINYAVAPGTHTLTYLIVNIAVLVFLILLNIPTHTLYIKYYSIVMRRVEAGLRGAMVRKLQQLSITFHKEMQSGRIQSKLMRDVETVHMLSSQLFSTLPGVIINMATALIVVIRMNLTVFAFFLLCVPAAVFTMRIFRRAIASTSKDFRVNMESTSASLMDMVEMTQITRAHALEDKEVKKLTHKLKQVAASGYKVDIVQNIFGACNWVVFQLFQLICLTFTVILAVKGKILVGDISLYQSYFTSLTGQVSTIIGMLPVITKGLDSISSIGEILAATDIEDNEGKTPMPTLEGEYEFRHVSFSYEENQPLLRDFNLKVKPGETIAFVGESGCGKTTSMNLILGFNNATGGEVLVDGHNIRDIDLHSYRQHIAIVPQNSVLFTGTIRENITYGIENPTEEQIRDAIEAAQLSKFIDSLPDGLDTMLSEHGANLSGGQRQRISIARAIIRNPSVIIFDEATSALDSVSEREIQKAIDNLTENHTTFIVAHRLSTIRNADRIAVLRDGRCEEIGSYDQLMAAKGLFYKMQTLQDV